MGVRRRVPLGGATVAGAVLLWGEWAHWRASRQDLPPAAAGARSGRADAAEPVEAIVVLGFPSARGDRLGAVQRYRVRIALRSRDPRAGRSVLVFTGRTANRPCARRSEAAVMADYAVSLGVDRADILLEEEATSTWENIENTLPLLDPFPVVKIVSNTFHARRGRRYLREQAPAAAARLRAAGDYRFGELAALKPLLALLRW